MLGFLRASTLGAAILVAVPAQAAIDLSDALVLVTDLGGSNYSFSQSGWTGGALVTGSFSGLDLDGDDQLNSFHGEISAFSMHFSGNGYAGAFSLGLADLHGLIYDLDGGPLGDGVSGLEVEGIAAAAINRLYIAGPGLLDVCGEGNPCAVALNVPEPSSWAMLIAGFGLTGAAMRRRRNYRAA